MKCKLFLERTKENLDIIKILRLKNVKEIIYIPAKYIFGKEEDYLIVDIEYDEKADDVENEIILKLRKIFKEDKVVLFEVYSPDSMPNNEEEIGTLVPVVEFVSALSFEDTVAKLHYNESELGEVLPLYVYEQDNEVFVYSFMDVRVKCQSSRSKSDWYAVVDKQKSHWPVYVKNLNYLAKRLRN